MDYITYYINKPDTATWLELYLTLAVILSIFATRFIK